MFRKFMVLIVVGCLWLSATAWAADEEQLEERSLTGNFLLVAQDGVLLAHDDFSHARFFALGGGVEWSKLGKPEIFENADRTMFFIYRDKAAFYVCHFNATGWKVQREDRFVPASIQREDAMIFNAISYAYESGADGTQFRITNTWRGTAVDRGIVWKLVESKKEEYLMIGCGGGSSYSSKCGVRGGGPLPEWARITSAQNSDSICILQRNNYQKDQRRFQVGGLSTDGGQRQLQDGEAFEFAAPVAKEAIRYFRWNGKDAESLDVLMSAVETKLAGEQSVEYLRWFVFKEAGARCEEPFEKQWQGRALLRLYTPVEK